MTPEQMWRKWEKGWLVKLPQTGWVWFKLDSVNRYIKILYAHSVDRQVQAAMDLFYPIEMRHMSQLMKHMVEVLYNDGRVVSAEGGWSGSDTWMWEEAVSLGMVEHSWAYMQNSPNVMVRVGGKDGHR